MLPLGLRPVGTSSEALVEDLLVRFLGWEVKTSTRQRERRGKLTQLRDCIATVAGGLLLAWGRDEPLAAFRSLKTNDFTGQSIGIRTFQPVMMGLEAMDLMHRQDGHRNHPGDSWASRYWPSAELLRIALGHGLTPGTLKAAFRSEAPVKPPKVAHPLKLEALKVRGRKAEPGALPIAADDLVAQALALDVREHNALAERTDVTGCLPPRFRRSFKHNWNLHGRWYALGAEGNYQRLSEEDRLKIRIAGEPVAEIDIAASFLTLLHGMLGLPAPEGDAYSIDGLPREVVKGWVNATIGKGSPVSRWAKKTTESYPECERHSAVEVGERVMARYPFLRDPCAVLPTRAEVADAKAILPLHMMNAEAAILTEAMRQLRQRGILSLSMHDGLIVPASAEELVCGLMRAAGERVAGVMLGLKVDRPAA